MTTPPDDELREFWERLVLALKDSPDTARFLYDFTVTGTGGWRVPPRPPLPILHPLLLELGKRAGDNWWPGEGHYTAWAPGTEPPPMLCNKCNGTGRFRDDRCPWCNGNAAVRTPRPAEIKLKLREE
jgi:hypothetical protein